MKKIIVVLLALSAFNSQLSWAQSDEQVKKTLDEQGQIISQLQKEVSQLKNDRDNSKEFTLPESLRWLERTTIYGDLRLRHETIEAENDDKMDRHRGRYRARIGVKTKINDQWSTNFRFATGGSSATSTNQTMGDGFSTKDLGLDLAYLTYSPELIDGLNVTGGKMKNPFYLPGKSSLIWDSDVTPEGAAINYDLQLDDNISLFANGGTFWAQESSGDVDASLWGAQLGTKIKINADNEFITGATLYDYGNIKGSTIGGLDMKGNTPDIAGNYANDYQIFEAFAQYNTHIGSMPFSVAGDYVNNLEADNNDTGWLVGFTVNKAKNPGSWQVSYDYRDLEADAVLGGLSDGDFIGGGTNGKGHRIAGVYQIAKNIQTAVSYFCDQRSDDENDYRVLQFDLIVKF
ncbi:MAG: putative porin [Phycisphaerae bacterium]|nr:putative porin [Phycisphaerae bacterium]